MRITQERSFQSPQYEDHQAMSDSSTIEQRLPATLRPIYKLNEHVLGATLICYILGFIITNLHLSSFGIVNFDVLRVRYILTGLSFLLFTGTIIVPMYDLFYTFREYHGKPFWKKILRFLWHYFVFFAFISVLSYILQFLGNTKLSDVSNFIGASLLLYLLISGLLLFAYALSFAYDKLAARFPSLVEEKTDPINRFFPWIYGIFFISVLIWFYSLHIYPKLPQQIGGGMLARVSLFTSNPKIEGMFTHPATEIFVINRTADTSLFLLMNTQQNTRDVIEIDNGEIEGFKYLPPL